MIENELTAVNVGEIFKKTYDCIWSYYGSMLYHSCSIGIFHKSENNTIRRSYKEFTVLPVATFSRIKRTQTQKSYTCCTVLFLNPLIGPLRWSLKQVISISAAHTHHIIHIIHITAPCQTHAPQILPICNVYTNVYI